MAHKIELTRAAVRALKKLPKQILPRIDEALHALSENPLPKGVVSLRGQFEYMRIRVGAYRIIYRVEDDRLVILVIRIGHRSDVYRNL